MVENESFCRIVLRSAPDMYAVGVVVKMFFRVVDPTVGCGGYPYNSRSYGKSAVDVFNNVIR